MGNNADSGLIALPNTPTNDPSATSGHEGYRHVNQTWEQDYIVPDSYTRDSTLASGGGVQTGNMLIESCHDVVGTVAQQDLMAIGAWVGTSLDEGNVSGWSLDFEVGLRKKK